MTSDVLVLNRNFQAVHVASWQKVFALLCKEHAVAIDEDYRQYTLEEWIELSKMMEDSPSGFIHTTTLKIAIPEVISLTKYDDLPKQDVKFSRKNIYKHYENMCCYCGNKYRTNEINLDQVLPKSRKGKTIWSNIVLSCFPCNSEKADRTPEEAGIKMHYKPNKPQWKSTQALTIQTGFKAKMSWKKFINKVYWEAELE